VLRGHCEAVGRDYDEIEKTVMGPLDLGENGEKTDEVLAMLQQMADLGVSEVHGWVPRVSEPGVVERYAKDVVPAAAQM
jgi:hypothetical protein